MVHGPVREVVHGPSPLDWSTDRGSVFSGHPGLNGSIGMESKSS